MGLFTPQKPLPSIQRLIELLQDESNWERDKYTLDHDSGFQLWIANGKQWLRICRPKSIDFTGFERRTLWPIIEGLLKKLPPLDEPLPRERALEEVIPKPEDRTVVR